MFTEVFLRGNLYNTKDITQLVSDEDVNIFVKVLRDVGLDQRLALEEGMGINQNQTTKQTFTSNIKIEVNKDPNTQTTGIKGFFATVSNNASEYFLFLLKMTLIVGIMLFIPSIIIGAGALGEKE